MYVKAPLLPKLTVPYEALLAFDAVSGKLTSPVPPCRPGPVAVNVVFGLLFAAPSDTKSVSPVVTIVYVFVAINEPSFINPAVSLVNTLPDTAFSKGVLNASSAPLAGVFGTCGGRGGTGIINSPHFGTGATCTAVAVKIGAP